MFKHLQTNKNIYITIGVLVVSTTVAYLSIYEVFNFKPKTDEED